MSRGLDCKKKKKKTRRKRNTFCSSFVHFLPLAVPENVDDPLAAAGLVLACRARGLGWRLCGGAGETFRVEECLFSS